MDAKRDWGHARDYCEAMWRILQLDQPVDLVIATGIQHSVRDFVNYAAAEIGLSIGWEGTGVNEIGRVTQIDNSELLVHVGQVIVKVSDKYFRPAEVESLLGDATQARALLNWQPQTSFEELVREMMSADFQSAKRDQMVKTAGFKVRV
jgi:GDPmannose 4,6-dehydratase